jgi:[ribosomal protein S18]-alanine N-acetyltransferase
MGVIRPATPGDLAALLALEQALFGPVAWSRSAMEAELVGAGRTVLIAEDAGAQPAGYAIALCTGETGDLMRIGVRTDHQRRGLAGILLTGVVDAVRESGAQRMLLEVAQDNEAAIALYRGHGFVTIDTRVAYFRDGGDALVMMATIEPTTDTAASRGR